jgi:hypothetical protein
LAEDHDSSIALLLSTPRAALIIVRTCKGLPIQEK